jgi:redox-sensitive bicupin YhaK (pirin superfamily)
MITIRPANERGTTKIDWLDSRHSFSFGDYFDPAHLGFRSLRVLNDDVVAPGAGFGMHPHRDMEILTWVLEGELEHQDTLGSHSSIRPGELQRMTAGTGILHSEYNPSETDRVRLLQIWLLPERKGLRPGYEQKLFPAEGRNGRLQLVASHDGREGSLSIHQDADVYVANLGADQAVSHDLQPNRLAWIQVARGAVVLNGRRLEVGDGAAVTGEPNLRLTGADAQSELLLFDLA